MRCASWRSLAFRPFVLVLPLLSFLTAPTAQGVGLELVLDVAAQGVDIVDDTTAGGVMAAVGTADGGFTIVTEDTDLFDVFRLDPTLGTAAQIATVDPTVAVASPALTRVVAGPLGEVYFLIGDGAMQPQQDVYRLDSGVLTPVVDLTAEGIELTSSTMGLRGAGVTSAGVIVLVEPNPMQADSFDVIRIDPTLGTATVAATVTTPTMFPFGLIVVAPQDEIYFLLSESGTGTSREVVYQVVGTALVERVDVTAAGFRVLVGSIGVASTAAAGSDGRIRVVLETGFAPFDYSTVEIEPVAGDVAFVSSADVDSLRDGAPIAIQSLPLVGFDGDVFVLARWDDLVNPVQQGLYRIASETRLVRVIDVTAQGQELVLSSFDPLPTGVSMSGIISISAPHPSFSDLRRLYRMDPMAGTASGPVTVDLGSAVTNATDGVALFGPDGEVYYLVGNNETTVQQGVFRLDGGSLTEVVDLTLQGFEVDFEGVLTGLGTLDGHITVVDQEGLSSDLFGVYRMDPTLGTAAKIATVDASSISGTGFRTTSPLLDLGGDVFFAVRFQNFPDVQEDLFRLDGGVLVPVVDLSAQGARLASFGSGVLGGTTPDGSIQASEGDGYGSGDVYRVDPSQGSAELRARVDSQALRAASPGAGFRIVPMFDPNGDVLYLASGGSFPVQQDVYRLVPEPMGVALQVVAIAVLGGVATVRRRQPRTTG